MTLNELLPAIRQLSDPDKLKLFRILATELEIPANIAPLEPLKVYHLSTPYNCFGAGETLMQAMKTTNQP